MQRFRLFGFLAVAMLMAASCDVWAQPQRGGQGQGQRGQGQRGGVQVQRFLPVEQVLSYLSFNENVALSDEQLVKVRASLKGVYTKRQELQRSLRGSNDQQAAMQQVRALRMEMTQGLTAILNEDQTKVFQAEMQRMSQRGQRGQRGGQGGRGGGRGGGGGGGGGGE
ncbi:MAG: hypothetical protein J4F29_05140 [Candidatus Latescibacteria bacterium]|nr:hypothetical protein [Candidatus Latescibacterota bacterium]